ncbi:MAG: hypothetical protein IBX40_08800 [Methanosarcinales archaeon]|jgi:hypothetical protein|nr:hypothetical protein [Methanosarcinales archaeon]
MGFLDEKKNLGLLKKLFYSSLIVLILLEIILMGIRETHISLAHIAEFPAFHAIYGFVGCVIMVFVVKFLGHEWLMKEEEYYD